MLCVLYSSPLSKVEKFRNPRCGRLPKNCEHCGGMGGKTHTVINKCVPGNVCMSFGPITVVYYWPGADLDKSKSPIIRDVLDNLGWLSTLLLSCPNFNSHKSYNLPVISFDGEILLIL